jgi:sortase B
MFVTAADEAEFNAFISRCRELSFYDTGISVEYGDKLLTLSTCEYSRQNNRLVVVAKRVE